MENNIYEDIFEAIRVFECNNPLLKLKDGAPKGKILVRDTRYMCIELMNGKLGAIPYSSNFVTLLYRGEYKDYGECFSSIYRTDNKRDILLNKLKIKELECILLTYDEIKMDIESSLNVDFLAIAQHYELKTNLIDLTSDIGVAAFFATNKYNKDKGEYEIVKDGIGVLKRYNGWIIDPDLHIEGGQRFQRPIEQHAYGIETDEDADSKFCKLYFKQNEKLNTILTNTFLENGENILFPQERILEIAKEVRDSNRISEVAIKAYANENGCSEDEIIKEIKSRGDIEIVKDLTYRITKEDEERFKKEEPKVEYFARLMYRGNGKKEND